VFENDDSTLSIYDWKRSKDISIKSFNNETGKYPLDNVLDANYYHYSLQLNLYKRILEKYYDKKIKEMFLVVLHPNNSNYEKINILNMEKEIDLILQFRLNEFKKENNNTSMEIESLKLSEKQKDALNKIIKGYNVFLTGAGGVGKSLIVKLFYDAYKDSQNIGITSTTGISSILIGGTTLHSFLGIGLGKDSVESLYLKIKKKAYMYKRWRDLNTLIIDEISMLSPHLFDKLELLARKLRYNELPFGGIQLILTGDFLQLPCVETDEFCFEAKSWDKCVKYSIYLTEIFRQQDILFQTCLNEVRIGKLSKKSIDILKSTINKDLFNSCGILPTKIYSLNIDVDKENQKELNKLCLKNKDLEFFEYELEVNLLKNNLKFVDEKIKKNCIVPQNLQLCIGAQVMLLYNINLEIGLANGSRGIITNFEDNLPVVKFINGVECPIDYQEWIIEENGEKIISITQIPLKVAYAITVHRSQGLTIDFAELDLSDIFEYGQAYVALSRVKNLDGLSIKNLNIKKIFANKKAIKYYENLCSL
jgi:ATP-dependent DNA helicase PIF1